MAPLSTLRVVFEHRSAESIPFLPTIMNFFSSLSWFFYGERFFIGLDESIVNGGGARGRQGGRAEGGGTRGERGRGSKAHREVKREEEEEEEEAGHMRARSRSHLPFKDYFHHPLLPLHHHSRHRIFHLSSHRLCWLPLTFLAPLLLYSLNL